MPASKPGLPPSACVSASRPQGGVLELALSGSLAVAIDPLDAAAIETNTPPGTLFSLYPAASGAAEASFLRPGSDQIAAGCVLYGPRTTLALATGQGTALFLLDRDTLRQGRRSA